MKPQRILVVEDDASHRTAMEKILQVHGYETCSCESGEHALPKIREESFGILITDFQMQGMDGLELIREAKRIHPEISAILVTGLVAQELRFSLDEKEVNGFFPKPIDWDNLINFLDYLLVLSSHGKKPN